MSAQGWTSADICNAAKEVLQKESGHCLCYINSYCTSMKLFQLQVAPLVLKFGIHQAKAEKKGWGGEMKREWVEGYRKPVYLEISPPSYRLGSRMLSPCQNQIKDDMLTNHHQILAFSDIKNYGADLIWDGPGKHKNIFFKFYVKNPCAETALLRQG
jgi:hypothetical protein